MGDSVIHLYITMDAHLSFHMPVASRWIRAIDGLHGLIVIKPY